MNQPSKTYVREFGISMLAYTILLPISLQLVRQYPASSWRFVFALLPVVALLFALLAFLRFFGHLDELQQRIQMHAFAFASGMTAFLTFVYGLLENVGLPHISYVFILPLIIALWGFGNVYANWRYR